MRFLPALMAISLASPLALAQSEVTHNGLFADHYAGEGNTAVLLVHGTLAHKRMEIIETLATLLNEDYDLPVVAPNLSLSSPARPGMVDCGQIHDHRHDDAVTEIGQWIQWMQQQGYGPIVVAGHSRGATQVSAYLATAPDSVVSEAVLIAPSTYDPETAAQRYETASGVSLEGVLARASQADPGTVLEVPRFVYCQDARATADAIMGYYAPDMSRDSLHNLQSIDLPTTIVLGSDDQIAADLPAKLSQATLGTHVTIATIDGADHFFRDLYADDIASLIAERLGL